MKKGDMTLIERVYQRARKKGVYSTLRGDSYASENRAYGSRTSGQQFDLDTKGFLLRVVDKRIESWNPGHDSDKTFRKLEISKSGEVIFRAYRNGWSSIQHFNPVISKGPPFNPDAERHLGSDWKPGEEWQIAKGSMEALELIRDKREKI